MANDWGDDVAQDWGDEREKVPTPESAARGGLQGLSLGWGDEGSAAIAASLPFTDREATGEGGTWSERYLKARDFYRNRNKQAQQDNPKTFTTGEVGGALVPLLATKGQAPQGSLLARIGQGAKAGAEVAGAAGAGESEATSLPELAKDATVSALLGAGMGGGMPVLGNLSAPVREWIASKLGRVAEGAAVRSSNADRMAFRKAFHSLDTSSEQAGERAREVGRFMLDEGVPIRSPGAMQEGLEKIIAEEGPKVGQFAQRATQAGAKVDLEGAALKALQDPDIAPLAANTEERAIYDRVTAFLDDQLKNGNQITPEKAHELRMTLDRLAKWEQSKPQQVVDAWRAVRRHLNDAFTDSMGQAGLGDEWAAANRRYSLASKGADLARVGAERRAANRFLGPAETAAAVLGGAGTATGAIMGSPETTLAGILAAGGTLAAKRLGMPATSRASNALSAALRPAPVSSAPILSQRFPSLAAYLTELENARPRFPVAAGDEDQR